MGQEVDALLSGTTSPPTTVVRAATSILPAPRSQTPPHGPPRSTMPTAGVAAAIANPRMSQVRAPVNSVLPGAGVQVGVLLPAPQVSTVIHASSPESRAARAQMGPRVSLVGGL